MTGPEKKEGSAPCLAPSLCIPLPFNPSTPALTYYTAQRNKFLFSRSVGPRLRGCTAPITQNFDTCVLYSRGLWITECGLSKCDNRKRELREVATAHVEKWISTETSNSSERVCLRIILSRKEYHIFMNVVLVTWMKSGVTLYPCNNNHADSRKVKRASWVISSCKKFLTVHFCGQY